MKKYFEDIMDNMRDIGGYTVKNNKKIAYHKVIRSNVPDKISCKEINKLIEMKINTIIDLRTSQEIEDKPIKLFQNNLFKCYHCNIKGGDKIPVSKQLVVSSYLDMLNEKEAMKKIFKIIANAKTGVLYYCNAGKDRTGVVTAILLSVVEVQEEEIIRDYQLSNTEFIKKYKQGCTKEIAEIITPKAEYMQKFLEEFKVKYGNACNYLLTLGVTEEEINKIKEKLIVKE